MKILIPFAKLVGLCDHFNENGLRRQCLNVWSSVNGTALGRIGGMDLLEEMGHWQQRWGVGWGGGFDFSKAPDRPGFSALWL